MCFHNALTTEAVKLENRYGAKLIPHSGFQPVYHASAFDNPAWPVITNEFPGVVQIFNWGLIPFWVKSSSQAEDIRRMTYNARVESMFEKKSFSVPAKTKRCLVPSTGFFEFQHMGKQKIPWFISHQKNDIFSMAGIWDVWTDPFNGKTIQTFSIVTTEANELMSKIHNTKKRMPLILNKNDEAPWLEAGFDNIKNKISENPSLKAHTVSGLINSKTKTRNVMEIQKPYIHGFDGLLF